MTPSKSRFLFRAGAFAALTFAASVGRAENATTVPPDPSVVMQRRLQSEKPVDVKSLIIGKWAMKTPDGGQITSEFFVDGSCINTGPGNPNQPCKWRVENVRKIITTMADGREQAVWYDRGVLSPGKLSAADGIGMDGVPTVFYKLTSNGFGGGHWQRPDASAPGICTPTEFHPSAVLPGERKQAGSLGVSLVLPAGSDFGKCTDESCVVSNPANSDVIGVAVFPIPKLSSAAGYVMESTINSALNFQDGLARSTGQKASDIVIIPLASAAFSVAGAAGGSANVTLGTYEVYGAGVRLGDRLVFVRGTSVADPASADQARVRTVIDTLVSSAQRTDGAPAPLTEGDWCQQRGLNYDNGEGVPQDTAVGTEILAHGCELNSAVSCANLASDIDQKMGYYGMTPNAASAELQAAQKSCDLGDAYACSLAAKLYLDPANSAVGIYNQSKGLDANRRGCSLGDQSQCQAASSTPAPAPRPALAPTQALPLVSAAPRFADSAPARPGAPFSIHIQIDSHDVDSPLDIDAEVAGQTGKCKGLTFGFACHLNPAVQTGQSGNFTFSHNGEVLGKDSFIFKDSPQYLSITKLTGGTRFLIWFGGTVGIGGGAGLVGLLVGWLAHWNLAKSFLYPLAAGSALSILLAVVIPTWSVSELSPDDKRLPAIAAQTVPAMQPIAARATGSDPPPSTLAYAGHF